MRKEILSITVAVLMLSATSSVFADTNYDYQSPVIQYAPADVNLNYQTSSNTYQTQYPLPVNGYQTQGYSNGTYANMNYNYNQQQLSGNVVMVPANTSFPATVMTPINSETMKAGDSVMFYLGSDFYYGKNLIAGAGSRLNGTVLQSKKGTYAGKNGKLEIKFTNIVTPSGQMIPISARIQTEDGTGILKAGSVADVSKDYAKNTAVGAASGAVLGTAMGALSGGKVGKGAVYGTAVGGGLGLIRSIANKGESVEIPQNSILNIVLDQPVTVSSNTPY